MTSRLAALSALLISTAAAAVCVPATPNAPENDCDLDGVTIGGGDCDDMNSNRKPGLPERCNNIDDDCDAAVDEGNPDGGAACTLPALLGVCAVGAQACTAGTLACRQVTDGGVELCDNLDNDCDSLIDESLTRPCFDGPSSTYSGTCPGSSCMPRLPCVGGNQTCIAGNWGVCSGQRLPEAERCDRLDDDCDGVVDNGDPDGGVMCSTALAGICSPGLTSCVSTGLVCRALLDAGVEVCDGFDNDCDGQTDEDVTDAGVACDTGEPGQCAAGHTTCTVAGLRCLRLDPPMPEICNGLDDDCDGVQDREADGGSVCASDAGLSDAGTGDAGVVDAGRDAGAPASDAGQADADAGADTAPPRRSAYGFGCSTAGAPLGVLLLLLAMRRRRRWPPGVVVVAAVLLSTPVLAAQPGLSFLGLKGNGGVSPDEVQAVSEYLQSRLVLRGTYRVTGPSEIQTLLGLDRQRQLLGCDEGQSCLTELAGALNSERTLSGQLAKVGTSVLVDLSLLDPKTGTGIHRVGRRFSGDRALDEVLSAIDPMLDELLERDSLIAPSTSRPEPRHPVVVAQVRGEADMYGSIVNRVAEISPAIAVSWTPGLLGLAGTVLLSPHLGFRVEGRVMPFRQWRVVPHAAVGATVFVLGGPDLGLRAALGAGTRLGPLWLSLDVAYERLLLGTYLPDAFVVALGLGWAFGSS